MSIVRNSTDQTLERDAEASSSNSYLLDKIETSFFSKPMQRRQRQNFPKTTIKHFDSTLRQQKHSCISVGLVPQQTRRNCSGRTLPPNRWKGRRSSRNSSIPLAMQPPSVHPVTLRSKIYAWHQLWSTCFLNVSWNSLSWQVGWTPPMIQRSNHMLWWKVPMSTVENSHSGMNQVHQFL